MSRLAQPSYLPDYTARPLPCLKCVLQIPGVGENKQASNPYPIPVSSRLDCRRGSAAQPSPRPSQGHRSSCRNRQISRPGSVAAWEPSPTTRTSLIHYIRHSAHIHTYTGHTHTGPAQRIQRLKLPHSEYYSMTHASIHCSLLTYEQRILNGADVRRTGTPVTESKIYVY